MSSNLPDRLVRIIGIDLGTTNTVVSELFWSSGQKEPPRARCLEIEQETREGNYTSVLVPSVIALAGGKEYIGEGARRLRARSSQAGLRRNANLFFECKNDIGLQRTYGDAPDGYRSAVDISARLLKRIWDEVLAQGPPPARTVITVPASFQAAQRQDTAKAAAQAGIELHRGDLLDEPIAAFLDYLATHGAATIGAEPGQRMLVFDFGGGTCDVALFTLEYSSHGAPALAPAGVSRYHRIGGADIDAAIVHQVLIPQLLQQNGLGPLDLSFEDKKYSLEPTLLGVAEALKVGLCQEMRRLAGFGRSTDTVEKRQPGRYECHRESGPLVLQSPVLSAAQFAEVIGPFVDPDLLYARETEYTTVASVFRPIQDALDRASWSPESVRYVLLTGGSSLIPHVEKAVAGYFAGAKLMTHERGDAWQTTVACGAAYHALALHTTGRAAFGVVAQDAISIRSSSGLVPLIPRHASLPYPAGGGFATNETLAVPGTALVETVEVRVELVAGLGEAQQVLFGEVWGIQGPVQKGEMLRVDYRLDESQLLELRVSLASDPGRTPLATTIESPLSHVVNPQSARVKADQIQEQLNSGAVALAVVPSKLVQLSELHAELGMKERAVADLRKAIAAKAKPDAGLLNKLASAYGQLGDVDREERYYREAIGISDWSGSHFNLALALRRQKKFEEAAKTADDALRLERAAPYLVLRGLIAAALGDMSGREKLLDEAFGLFGDALEALDDFELSWFVTAAQINDPKRLAAGRAEQKRRFSDAGRVNALGGLLPDVRPALVRQEGA